MAVKLKVCTFNLRMKTAADGINNFDNRAPRVLETIKSEAPDLIGFQEATDEMRLWLNEALTPLGYTVVGCGRNADLTGEGTPIAYRAAAFDLISFETKWLSATPNVPGSRYGLDQSSCPRIFTATVLKHKKGAPFLFLNTHLDHKGSMAKLLGTVQILQYISEKGLPFITTGDTNDIPTTAAMTLFAESAPCGRPTVDATAKVGKTFHKFGTLPEAERRKIDYIFTDLVCDAKESYAVADEGENGIYISDHYPVVAYISL